MMSIWEVGCRHSGRAEFLVWGCRGRGAPLRAQLAGIYRPKDVIGELKAVSDTGDAVRRKRRSVKWMQERKARGSLSGFVEWEQTMPVSQCISF